MMNLDKNTVGRIAPTPSGFLHVGNAYSFVLTWLLVRSSGGELILRVDDIDTARYRREYLEDIFETLDWLGLDMDKGPSSVREFEEKYSQSLRLDEYGEALQTLKNEGRIFPCGCSRKRIKEDSVDGQYPGTCREKTVGFDNSQTAWRVKTEDRGILVEDAVSGELSVNLHEKMRDFVVRKKDGMPAYQLVSLVDDIREGVNLVVRGADLLESTAAQLFLAEILALDSFREASFYHHPLLLDASGEKLSKSQGSLSLKYIRENGGTAKSVFGKAAKSLGLAGNISTAGNLLSEFGVEKLPKI
ncbi:glutamyl-Q tRNA(Asp) synthetase [Fulvitalea axinellae]|uniref:Glutamyl-Q tRNA(Asp) synthetase n=1 Tax=Fulvitalea axinellae TaxID=1182444 RepID=A0AAU9CWW0_9BACT|nr:glutamyl-Q tRNA(Asp) synthetase [Fulvitalea axinellae]